MKTIIIFIKAPQPGQVKTRLAANFGAHRAANLYRAMAIDTVTVARAVQDARVIIAYDGKNPRWLVPGKGTLRWIRQQGKTLGHRLIHSFHRVLRRGGGPVIVIGSDLPALTPALLANAFRALKHAPLVLGPSRDGGYYLIGLSAEHSRLFRGIPWSSPKVLSHTLAAAKKLKLPYRLLRREQDIDTIEDVKRFQSNVRKNRGMKFFKRTRMRLKAC